MQKRILMLPLIWGVFGVGEVLGLTYLFGPIVNVQYPQNDKPIGGSYLPALGVISVSGFLVFYLPIFLFPLAVALVYFLATNID